MWLIVDDMRELGCNIIARTPEAGMHVLCAMSDVIECLCIDHDFGERSEKDGTDVIKFAIENNCLPDRVQIVSQNPVGVDRIRNLLIDEGYVSRDRINYFKYIYLVK